MADIKLREAVISDLDEILSIENQSFNSEAFNRRQFRYLINSSGCIFQVAQHNGTIAGCLILLKRKNSRLLRIYSIAVSPNHRGLGIAQVLIDYTSNYAKSGGYKTVSLEVNEKNEPAIRLYQKNGFRVTARRLHYYSPGEHALVMRIII